MGFAAATCLKKTIERLLNYPQYIYLVPPSREAIEVAHKETKTLMVFLKFLDNTSKGKSRKRVNALDAEIREVVSKFEDVLESHVTDQLLSQSDLKRTQFSIDLMELKQDICFFVQRVVEFTNVHNRVVQSMLGVEEEDDDEDEEEDDYYMFAEEDDEEEEEEDVVSSVTDFGEIKSSMVGLCDQFRKTKAWVLGGSDPGRCIIGLFGMGGIGKTILAKKVFDDPDVINHFHHRLWVTLGRNCLTKEILRVLIAQLNPDNDQILAEEEKDMTEYLNESLKGRRFLIVVDDVWAKNDYLPLLFPFPDDMNGSVLLTSRLRHEVISLFSLEVRFLNKEESWELLREKVFGKESCPRELEKIGKKIAEKCDGLPLTILSIARLLIQAEMTPEFWDEVARDRNSFFTDTYEEISEVLYPSYDYLPQHLKMCFLSAGVFPKKTMISRSKLVNMWGVEEFLVTSEESHVKDLVSHSLFMMYETSSTHSVKHRPSIKTFGVHSSLLHICKREARNNKSFHVLSSRKDGLSEDMKSQRRLSIHNNVLFAIKDVHISMEDEHCSSTARSLGCYGPYLPYQVPITFGLRLLRLLDALTIRLYEFPTQVLKLILLRYLALNYSGMLPGSISKLWNLQFLIVRQHLRIVESLSYLPIEIWDMKELKHLHVTGSDLPDPTSVDAFLPNLSTLLEVSGNTCTDGVLRRTPSLERLGLRIELRPGDEEPFSWFAHISCLERLKIFKCVIVNSIYRPEIFASPTPLPNFQYGLRKLTLSGLCYPWEEISKIAAMHSLEVLKLRNYAFRGPEWHMKEYSFKKLAFLLIEDTDLVQWKVAQGSFSDYSFSCISLKHCYKLEEIDWDTYELPSKIRVVDCNPLILPCWKKIILYRCRFFPKNVDVDAHFSWMMDK